jgi:hypothetical protein
VTYPNPLVAEIEAELDARDGMVDNVIAFALAAASAKIRNYGDPADEWAANLIDPNHQEQP